ncbi:MAG TPA: hypothetical protein VIE68_05080 [Gemmatimonadota bacterium]
MSALVLIGACNGSSSLGPPTDPNYDPMIDAADFDGGPIDNPYYSLIPGTTFHLQSGSETNDVIVTFQTKQILGITATVVHDQVFADGELTEDTFDWFAQDNEGNIWYLGEDSRELENGEVVSTEGSWEAGVDGAKPGIIMQADPQVGQRYYEEFYLGHAEDEAIIVSLNASAVVPFGEFAGCLETNEFTRLEPGVGEHKFYCPGIGLVLEEASSGDRNELIGIDAP